MILLAISQRPYDQACLFKPYSYHDSLEAAESDEEMLDELLLGIVRPDPVLYNDRPFHCDNVELQAQSLRTTFSGLSSTSLLKSLYFSKSTPLFSPPTISIATPTDVQTSTIKYFEPFLQERKLIDPIPRSWVSPRATYNFDDLVSVPKECIHMFDGDSGEITIPDADDNLQDLATHERKIRFRMKHCDAPESEYAVQVKKQPEGSTVVSKFVTRHIGVESLRAARQMLFEAAEVFLQVQKDSHGHISTPKDFYGRRLVNIFLCNKADEMSNFAVDLASSGHTMSFYTTGIDDAIDSAMRAAITDKRGIFSLPEECFTHPYCPWDMRKLWGSDDGRLTYSELRPILNRPSDPAIWTATTGTDQFPQPLVEDADADLADSQSSDNFLFNIGLSKLGWESRCYVHQSTIPNAGRGLFVKPHDHTIDIDSHLCIYAEKSTTLEEIAKNGSSHVYAVYSPRKKRWFDAEHENGNNIGRFANQPRRSGSP